MKRTISLLTLSCLALQAMAQDPYLNNHIVSATDIHGTSRFVAMGGAMGALGADISAISSNPAALGFFTKSEVSLTGGASWLGNHSASGMAESTFGQFDQVGTVVAFKLDGDVRTFNIGFNYQRKASFDNSFYGEARSATSWADQLDALAAEAYDHRGSLYGTPDTYFSTLYGLADECGLFPWNFQGEGQRDIVKDPSDPQSTLYITSGAINAFDFNLSMNLDDRWFFGLTLGLDNIDYCRTTDYWEQRTATNGEYHDFGYINEQVITGTGYNIKFGAIVRPFDASTFRVGLTVETPTWYNLKYADNQGLTTKYQWNGLMSKYYYDDAPGNYYTHDVYDLSGENINYLEYRIVTPWKVRLQMGSTVGTSFAWGVEYQFANSPGTTMKYPGSYGGYNTDRGFIDMTKEVLKPQHTLRAGIEFKPVSKLSLRAGYNLITSSTRSDAQWDPFFSDAALSYPTGLDYMHLSDTHIFTLGLGYRSSWFYADLAYKYNRQRGHYYAFNPYYSQQIDPTAIMAPLPVNLDRHAITATLGIRF